MFEIVFPLYLIVISLCVFSYLQHHALSASIRKVADDIEARLNGDVSVPESFLTELKDEMGGFGTRDNTKYATAKRRRSCHGCNCSNDSNAGDAKVWNGGTPFKRPNC